MSVFYSVEIVLNFKYEKNNIDHFFQKCIENNIHLYPNAFDNIYKLESNGATARILSIELEAEERCVRAKFQDTDFSIFVNKEKNSLLSFSINGFGTIWRKEFINDNYGIDFARYIRLLLRVCQDFTILALETDVI